MKYQNLIITSTIMFVIATLWQQTLHEGGHFLAAHYFGAGNNTLYHNYVQYQNEHISQAGKILIAAAGPLLSLMVGLLFHAACAVYKRRDQWFLFMLYMCIFGYINIAGYLMIAPLFSEGDTGYIFHALGLPLWSVILIALAGVAIFLWLLKYLWEYFAQIATPEILADPVSRKSFADGLIKYPLFAGIGVTILLNLPVISVLSLIYPAFSPMSLFWVYGYVVEETTTANNSEAQLASLGKPGVLLIAALLLTVVVNRLLVMGLVW